MDQSPPSLEHRHKRRALLAQLWLARVVRLLSGFANIPMPDAWRGGFDHVLRLLTRLVVFLVLIRADQLKAAPLRVRNPRQIAVAMKRHDVRARKRCDMRAVTGGRLRRAVKISGFEVRDFQVRAEKLLCVLNALDAWAARIAYRARNGMTRIMNLHNGVALSLPACGLDALSVTAGLAHDALGSALRVADTS
jgi:hypothetical protein